MSRANGVFGCCDGGYVCGVFAGKNIQQLWALPIIAAGLFLAGAWLFFEMGEMTFLEEIKDEE